VPVEIEQVPADISNDEPELPEGLSEEDVYIDLEKPSNRAVSDEDARPPELTPGYLIDKRGDRDNSPAQSDALPEQPKPDLMNPESQQSSAKKGADKKQD